MACQRLDLRTFVENAGERAISSLVQDYPFALQEAAGWTMKSGKQRQSGTRNAHNMAQKVASLLGSSVSASGMTWKRLGQLLSAAGIDNPNLQAVVEACRQPGSPVEVSNEKKRPGKTLFRLASGHPAAASLGVSGGARGDSSATTLDPDDAEGLQQYNELLQELLDWASYDNVDVAVDERRSVSLLSPQARKVRNRNRRVLVRGCLVWCTRPHGLTRGSLSLLCDVPALCVCC